MAFKANPEIYTEFINKIELSPHHERILQEKRGFTPEQSALLKFRSAGEECEYVIGDMLERHNSGDLLLAGLITPDGKPTWQVRKEELIIIPYLAADGVTVNFLKSHKFGSFKDSGIMPYCDFIYDTIKSDTVILCESEFKAAAMYCMGYKAIGLGGITSFAGYRIMQLQKLLETDEIKKIIIFFDSEIQDNPEFSNYKNDFRRRYAQHVYAFIIARKLQILFEGKQKQITVAGLPRAWMEDGKADIDGCVARGHKRDEFDRVLAASVSPVAYLDMMDVKDDHKPWVQRKIKTVLDDGLVEIEDNSYFISSTKIIQGVPLVSRTNVSNFKMQLKSSLKREGDNIREVQLINRFGDRSKPFSVNSKQIASHYEFKQECLKHGDFIWKGSEQQWNTVTENMFLESDIVQIEMREIIGRDEDNKQWLFGNVILCDDGSEIEVGEDGLTFLTPDKGFRLSRLNNAPFPELCREPIDINEIIDNYHAAWGINGIKILAYSIGSLFADIIFGSNQMFPLLLIYGEKSSGKSTASDALMFPLGFTPAHSSMNLNDTTAVAMNRNLAYYSSLPCRFDEYRSGEKKIDDKQSIMRSIYNRQTASKGTRANFGTREVLPKAAFVMIGEEKPNDPALMSRFVPIYLTYHSQTPESQRAMRWIYDNHKRISYLGYKVLKNYATLAPEFLASFKRTLEGMAAAKSLKVDYRTQQHTAFLMTALGVFCPEERAGPYMQQLMGAHVETATNVETDSALYRFFEDVNTMRCTGEDVAKYVAKERGNPDHVAVYFQGIYQSWAKFKQQRGSAKDVFNERTVKDYLKSQPYFVSNNASRTMTLLGEEKRVNCIIVDASSPFIPKPFKDMILDTIQVSVVIGNAD